MACHWTTPTGESQAYYGVLGRGCPVFSSGPEARIRSSPAEKPPCALMAPGACKIRRECNVLQIPTQIIPLGVLKRGSHPLRGG